MRLDDIDPGRTCKEKTGEKDQNYRLNRNRMWLVCVSLRFGAYGTFFGIFLIKVLTGCRQVTIILILFLRQHASGTGVRSRHLKSS